MEHIRKIGYRGLALAMSLALAAAFALPTPALGAAPETGGLGVAATLMPLDAIGDPGSPVGLVDTVATPVDLLDGTVVNYLLLEVKDSSYATATYSFGSESAVPTPVLTDQGDVEYAKLAVPAGVTTGVLTITFNSTDYTGAFTAATAGVHAPVTVYGTTSMEFSEFYYDITADITTVEPASTAFATGGTVAAPQNFITAGTRQQWAANDSQAKVDVISSATYGDAVHFIPTGNYILNYDPPTTKGVGHEVQGYKSIDVAISVDLLANATLLDATGFSTAQSTAVLEKVANVTAVAASAIYKPKHLQIDGNWGARAATAVTQAAAAAWPGGALNTTVAYGGNFTNREVTFTFTNLLAELTANSAAGLWDQYLNNIYGGYVEGPNGHREPLIWLQNLFTHKAHTNFEVSINQDVFARFGALGLPGDLQIVVYAKGLQDITATVAGIKTVADNDAAIEQGTTFYVKQGDATTYFEGEQLHIVNLSQGTYDSLPNTNAKITKGSGANAVDVDPSLYSIEKGATNGEAELSFSPAFFTSPTVNGNYVISLVPADASTWYKTYGFTVNLLVDRPTLAVDGSGAFAGLEVSPVTAVPGALLTFSSETYAKAVSVSARGGSTITDMTPQGATTTPAIAEVLKLSGAAGSAYQIDTTALALGHTYCLNVITSGFATNDAQPSTTTQYFITLVEAEGKDPEEPVDPEPDYDYSIIDHFGEFKGMGSVIARINADNTLFVKLLNQGIDMPTSAYTVRAGSTIIEINESYLKALKNGSYTITAVFSDGTNVQIPLVVNVAATSENQGGGRGAGAGSGAVSGNGSSGLPSTGDSLAVGIGLTALALALAAAVCGTLGSRRRRQM
ncbi:MAG: hypothetical protein LBU31_04470 [Coriobacteriales bacterium]|nr:hypothetical protein [Coriobacteriales bacterium]